MPTHITLEVERSDTDRPSRFEVPVQNRATRVLDALLHVREHLDPSLAFRYACRAGMCGSCAVVINGREALSCQTSIAALGTPTVHVSPLRALPVLHDLVCDMAPFFATFKRADAALRPAEPARTTPRVMPPAEPRRALIERQNGCITCGACFSACAPPRAEPDYLGPAALNRVLMLALDERDAFGKKRLSAAAAHSGVPGAERLRHCSAVCPVDIPLEDGIAKLEQLITRSDVA